MQRRNSGTALDAGGIEESSDYDVAQRPSPKLAQGLGEYFRTRYEVVPAVTDALRDHAYRLRHSVYCEDLGFEPKRPDGREIDEYDAHATALLVRHITTGEFVACARLVRPRPDAIDEPLPFERTCGHALKSELIDSEPVPRSKIAEVSRLAVISKFRRRKGEAHVPVPVTEADFGTEQMPRFPYILIGGLYFGIIAAAKLQGLETLFLLSEPRLATHFSRLGIDMVQIGDPVEHRGQRIPSMFRVGRTIAGLNRYVRPLYDEVLRELISAGGLRDQ